MIPEKKRRNPNIRDLIKTSHAEGSSNIEVRAYRTNGLLLSTESVGAYGEMANHINAANKHARDRGRMAILIEVKSEYYLFELIRVNL